MYYYLSIGTNIEPEMNAVRISTALAHAFGQFALYPFIYTAPVNMQSKKVFLNSLAIIHSDLDAKAVKHELNIIEMQLGRDRQDPMRSEKDRTADIDILAAHPLYDESLFLEQDAPYIPLVLGNSDHHSPIHSHKTQHHQTPSVEAISHQRVCADLSPFGLPLALTTPQRPTTIYFNARTGHVAVIDNSHRRLHNRLESSFAV